jgi:ABC-2 type transport system permease protein
MNWWRFVVANEIRKILAFRTDFWVTFIGQTLVQILIARALWQSIFESSGAEVMEGFTLPMMTLYYLIVPIGTRILTGENIGFLSREIYDGSFNRYLIYPVSFFQYKTLTYMTYSCFYALQLTAVYLIFNMFRPEGITPDLILNLGLGILFFLMASFTYAMFAITIELIALWADNIWSLMVMSRFFTFFFGGSFVPLAFFPEWSQALLKFTPFPYLVSLPIKTTMGISSAHEMGMGIIMLILWSLIFIQLAKSVWKRGQLRYTGVGI